MRRLLITILIFSSIQTPAWSNEDVYPQNTVWKDLWTSIIWIGEGSYKQFNTTNATQLGVAVPLIWWAFERDDDLLKRVQGKEVGGFANVVSDSSILASFAVIQVGFYFWGRGTDDSKMVRFAMESFSTMYLALIESAILSYAINVHERPSEGTNPFETSLRGDSSFPSGHVVPYSALFLKTFQFYGPWWSLIPAFFMGVTAYERVASGKHYLSDVVGGFFAAQQIHRHHGELR